MLISIETHITCDFPVGGGVSGPSIPPLDPHMHCTKYKLAWPKIKEEFNLQKNK